MPTLDLRAHLRSTTERAHALLVKDLHALPEDKSNLVFGGVARPALEFVVECGTANEGIAGMLQNNPSPRRTPEERTAFFATFITRQQALDYLEEQTQGLLATFDTLDLETLGEIVETPLGLQTRFALAELAATHMMYHDGQLNYLQALHGDGEIHW